MMSKGELAALIFGLVGLGIAYKSGYHNYALMLAVGSALFLLGLRWAKQERSEPRTIREAVDQAIIEALGHLDEPTYKCTKCSATVREYFNFCPRCGQSKGDGWPCSK